MMQVTGEQVALMIVANRPHRPRLLSKCASVVGVWVLGIACLIAAGPVENKEFGFRASVPAGFPVCFGTSGTHVHGVGTLLARKQCDARGEEPGFDIWADYNTRFEPDALTSLEHYPNCAGSTTGWAADQWRGAIGGLRTAMCRVENPDGQIEIVLEAQAGKWPSCFEENAPYINYTVHFHTTKARETSDMRRFRAFLRSIEIINPTATCQVRSDDARQENHSG